MQCVACGHLEFVNEICPQLEFSASFQTLDARVHQAGYIFDLQVLLIYYCRHGVFESF
jgi:hypothetical protein